VTARYRWVILAVAVGAQAAISAVRQGLPALGPVLRDTFDLSLPQLGIALGSVTVGIMLTLIAWGVLADRIGERPVIAAGLAGSAVALVAAAFATGFAALTLALVVAGMLGASATGASGRAVMGWFGRSERGTALGIRQTGVPIGGAVAALSLPALAATWGLRGAMIALAVVCAVGAAAAWTWLREAPAFEPVAPPPPAPPPLRDRRLWRLATGSGLLVLAQSSLLGFVVVYLHDERGITVGAAAAVLAALQVGGAVARVAAGRWSDRRDERVQPVRTLIVIGSALLLAVAAAAAAGAPTALVLGLLLAAGLPAMSWNGLSFTAAAEMSGRARAGTAVSVQNTVLSAAGAVAPVAFGALVVATSWPAAWVGLAACQLAGVVVLAPLVDEEHERRDERERRLAAAQAARRRGSWQASAPTAQCEGRAAVSPRT
jgi:sugar phosphate permease